MNRTRNVRCRRPPGRDGFGLVELICIIGIVTVLALLATKSLVWSKPEGRLKACQRNLQNIYVALELYARDNGGKFPVVAGAQTSEEALHLLVPRYTSDTAAFICPATKDPEPPAGEPFRKAKISYAYYMGRTSKDAAQALMSDRQIDTRPRKAGDLVFSSSGQPPANNHGSRGNFLFGDGRVEWSPANSRFTIELTPDVVLLNPKP